jgi:hypothetical protein
LFFEKKHSLEPTLRTGARKPRTPLSLHLAEGKFEKRSDANLQPASVDEASQKHHQIIEEPGPICEAQIRVAGAQGHQPKSAGLGRPNAAAGQRFEKLSQVFAQKVHGD